MRGMKGISVDPEAQTVRAEGGVNWGEFDAATTEHGLVGTGGRVPSTGIAGLALGSGSGWIERKFGFVCDNLIAGRGRHRRRSQGDGVGDREPRPLLGSAGRRRQLRHRHRLPLPAAPAPAGDPRGDADLARRGRHGARPLLPRFHALARPTKWAAPWRSSPHRRPRSCRRRCRVIPSSRPWCRTRVTSPKANAC